MNIYISKDYKKLKYYTVLTYAILPALAVAFSVEYVFSFINATFDGWFSYAMPLSIIALCILSSVFLSRFSKAGPVFLAVLFSVFTAISLADCFASDLNDTQALAAYILVSLLYVGWGLCNHIYFVARKPLFFSETEEFIAPDETEPHFWRNLLKITVLVLLVWVGYLMMEGLEVGKADEVLETIYNSGNVTALRMNTYQRIIPNLFLGIALWAAGVVMMVTSHKSKTADYVLLGISKDKKPVRSFLIGAAAGLLTVLAAALVLFISGSKLVTARVSSTDLMVMLVNLFYFSGVGFTEEMMYRGIVMGYGKKKNSIITASVVSLVGFVVFHFLNGAYKDPNAAYFLFSLGLAFTLLRIYSDNLWLCIGMHSLYDWGINHFISINPMGTGESFFRSNVITIKRMHFGVVVATLIFCAVITVLLVIKNIKKTKTAE